MDKDGYNDLRAEYERGFIDGMQEQARRSVDRAVNAMVKPWVGLTKREMESLLLEGDAVSPYQAIKRAQAKLKEKNT